MPVTKYSKMGGARLYVLSLYYLSNIKIEGRCKIYSLGISDSWYALRIDRMIEENKLSVVEHKDPSHPYGKILRKI